MANFTAPDSGCGPHIVDFTNNSVGKYINFLWDLGFDNISGNDSTSTDTWPTTQSYPAGIYFDTTYYTSLTVSNQCGVSTQNLEIISKFNYTKFENPCLIGISRKGFLKKLSNDPNLDQTSVTTGIISLLNGAKIIRTHNVPLTATTIEKVFG